MIDILTHRRILLNVLKDIYQDKTAAAWLGFKGGTCLYFFYDLPRFSTDLDFNLLVREAHFKPKIIENILKQYIELRDYAEKSHTYFWLGSYSKTHQNVKVEISRRETDDEYEIKDFYGIGVTCMKPAYLFAHKLCAIHDRKKIANRDLFDAHFMFKNLFPFKEEIIRKRTGMEPQKYFELLADYIPKHLHESGILHGMGHLLDDEKKKWAKCHLLKELLFYLKSSEPSSLQ